MQNTFNMTELHKFLNSYMLQDLLIGLTYDIFWKVIYLKLYEWLQENCELEEMLEKTFKMYRLTFDPS